MILLTIIIIIIIAVTIVIFVKKTEKFDFNAYATLIQTLLVFIALWITVFTIQSTNSDTKTLFRNLENFNNQFSKMESSLTDVSKKLRLLPKQIDNFSSSLDTLNTITRNQSVEFKSNTRELNFTIKNLAESVTGFEDNINSYSEHIKSIVDLTDKQLKIWKEQQRVLLDEFSRKPILKLIANESVQNNDNIVLGPIKIINDGNIEASILAVYVIFPANEKINLADVFMRYKTENNKIFYRYNFLERANAEIVAANSSVSLCTYNTLSIDNKRRIEYGIDYTSKYGSGQQKGFIEIK